MFLPVFPVGEATWHAYNSRLDPIFPLVKMSRGPSSTTLKIMLGAWDLHEPKACGCNKENWTALNVKAGWVQPSVLPSSTSFSQPWEVAKAERKDWVGTPTLRSFGIITHCQIFISMESTDIHFHRDNWYVGRWILCPDEIPILPRLLLQIAWSYPIWIWWPARPPPHPLLMVKGTQKH